MWSTEFVQAKSQNGFTLNSRNTAGWQLKLKKENISNQKIKDGWWQPQTVLAQMNSLNSKWSKMSWVEKGTLYSCFQCFSQRAHLQ